ncbi:PHP domain-containing protein [Clostridium sediminicola]|uniref:PHP-associated domain-containing protein n=1 Tax=Clostridium sediminicola TaxID=3114879 RepID=UPI0031F1F2E4
MIIDIHFHTKEYSPCSHINMEEGIKKAKEIGLDGICITDHDNRNAASFAKELEEKYGILVIVGVEVYTYEGDILCFGLDKVPEKRIHAQELIDLVNEKGGVTIAAHPFRNNGRGLGNEIKNLKGLSAIEVLNGNTTYENNSRAYELAKELNISCAGGSDSHKVENIGKYSTKFIDYITNEKELIKAIKLGRVELKNMEGLKQAMVK